MFRRLVIAFAVLAALVVAGGRAYALTDGEACDEGSDEAAFAQNASFALPTVLPSPEIAPLGGPLLPNDDACHGDRLTDDPACWPDSPTGAPPSGGFAGLGGPDVILIGAATLPDPDCSIASPLPDPAGAEHPGYARGIERPPRSF